MMPRPRYRRSYIAERRRRWAPVLPYWGMALALALGLLSAPWIYHYSDVAFYYLRWMQHTSGAFPWRAYDRYAGTCDYPPVIPYVLTLVEAVRLLLGEGLKSPVTLALVKLPSLLAWVGGAFLCLRALPPLVGWPRARKAAACYLLATPLFVNAALWGQWDTLLCLGLLATLLAVAKERLLLVGVLLGLSASIKLQALLIVPLLVVYGLRRFGVRQMLAPTLAGLATMGLLAAPIALAGRTDALKRVYLDVSALDPVRSLSAYNGWYLLDGYDVKIRRQEPAVARLDTRPIAHALPLLTFQRVGQALLGAYLALVLWALWKRPTRYFLLLACAMAIFGLFVLPTRAHDRYILPTIALLAVLAPLANGPRTLFLGLCVTSTLNELIALVRSNSVHLTGSAAPLDYLLPLAAAISVANLALFVYGTWALLRAKDAPVLFDNPLDWPDARRAESTLASVTRQE